MIGLPLAALKAKIKYILQRLLGFESYLFVFSVFKILTLKQDSKEGDFFFFLSFVKPNSAVLDIGANIGIMTYHLSKKVGKEGKVICFEPMQQNVSALKKVIKFFKLENIRLETVALGEEKGTVEMVMPVLDEVKMQGLSHVVHDSITEFNEGERRNVIMTTLDSENWTDLEISGLKLDVENFESFVLRGGKKLLLDHKPVVYAELWENQNRQDCFDFMKSLEYKIFVVNKNNIEEYNKADHSTQNFIFLPAKVEA